MAQRRKTARFRSRDKDEADDQNQASRSGAASRGRAGGRSSGRTTGRTSSRQGGRAGSRAGRGTGPNEGRGGDQRVGRDGKVQISCPSCSAQYRILPDHMDSKVTCRQCHRTFFPSAAAGAGSKRGARRKQNQATPFIAFGAAVVVIIIIGLLIANSGEEPPKKQEPVVEAPDLGSKTQQVQDIMRWCNAILLQKRFQVEDYTSFDTVQKQLKIDTKVKHSNLMNDERRAMTKKIVDALLSGPDTEIFQYCEPRRGTIMDAAYLKETSGKVKLILANKKEREGEVIVDYVQVGSQFKVAGWQVVHAPKRPRSKEDIARSRAPKHKKIPKPKVVTRTLGGKTYEARESELVPLDHLAETPPELKKEIDTLISHVMDHSDPRRANRAILRLEEIGKPAVPRLLNKMYEVKPKGRDDVEALNRVVKLLRVMTGQAFGYNPRDLIGQNVGGSSKERESALKQWYGWWYSAHASKRWNELVDREDEELLTEEEVKAKRKAERKAAREARKKNRKKK